MKPSTDKYYQVKELTIYNVVKIVIQEYATFSKNELLNICLLNTDFTKMIPKLKQWLQIDFSTLREPRLNYESQMQIHPHRVFWQMLLWLTLALIREDSSDGWVASIWASIKTHTQS
jgi:hypothetical protein